MPANGLQAWAAVTYAWGGLNASASSVSNGVRGSANRSFLLVPKDPTAPIVLFAGNASTFGSILGSTHCGKNSVSWEASRASYRV